MDPVKSIFDVFNKKETGLSRSLAAMFYADYTILKKLLKANRIILKAEDLNSLDVFFEPTFGLARFDVYCLSKNYAIVIEIKIGVNIVENDQLEKYKKELRSFDRPNKILILLTQFKNQKKYASSKSIKIINSTWEEIYSIVKLNKIVINLDQEFKKYLTGSHMMKISDMDIWAVVVRGKELKKLKDQKVYRNYKYHQPVFIGLREWDKNEKRVIVKKLYPVKEILQPKDPRARLYNEGNKTDYVYVLGDPMVLENPIRKKFSQQSAISLQFDKITVA